LERQQRTRRLSAWYRELGLWARLTTWTTAVLAWLMVTALAGGDLVAASTLTLLACAVLAVLIGVVLPHERAKDLEDDLETPYEAET
jgi:hypothetical protein